MSRAMHRAPSPRRHRQHRAILALYLIAMLLVLVTWLTSGPTPV